VGGTNTPRAIDAPGVCSFYDRDMNVKTKADSNFGERSAVQLFLLDQQMSVIARATYWPTISEQPRDSRIDAARRNRERLPRQISAPRNMDRNSVPGARVVVVLSHLAPKSSDTGTDTYNILGAAVEPSPLTLLNQVLY
jgi:hypothetical protein